MDGLMERLNAMLESTREKAVEAKALSNGASGVFLGTRKCVEVIQEHIDDAPDAQVQEYGEKPDPRLGMVGRMVGTRYDPGQGRPFGYGIIVMNHGVFSVDEMSYSEALEIDRQTRIEQGILPDTYSHLDGDGEPGVATADSLPLTLSERAEAQRRRTGHQHLLYIAEREVRKDDAERKRVDGLPIETADGEPGACGEGDAE